MSNLSITTQFEAIKKTTEKGAEYWTARELQPRLGYANWQNFVGVIKKAIAACHGAGMNPGDHFIGSSKMVTIGSGDNGRRGPAGHWISAGRSGHR